MYKVGIISIGDEILNGVTIDTNSSYISNKISKFYGLEVSLQVSVGDNLDSIIENINNFVINEFKYVFVTGGLGPTHDDITKFALKKYLNLNLEINETYQPNKLFIGSSKESDLDLLENKYVQGSTMIYVCENNACKLPTNKVMDALKQMK